MNVRVEENHAPLFEADEIREEVIVTLKNNSKYQLPEVQSGSDSV